MKILYYAANEWRSFSHKIELQIYAERRDEKGPGLKPKKSAFKKSKPPACKVFFKKGYQNATVAEIAKLADIREGTIYLYFLK